MSLSTCGVEVCVRWLYNSWWFCVHKLSMFIYLSMYKRFKCTIASFDFCNSRHFFTEILKIRFLNVFVFVHVEVLKCWSVEVLKCWSVEVLKCWSVQVLKFWSVEVLKCGSVEVLKCSSVQVFKCSSVQVFKCSSVQVFKCSSVQVLELSIK